MYKDMMFAKSVLEIDLSRVLLNYQKISSLVGNCNIAAVVKAEAYGLGAAKIIETLYKEGCRDFCFAYLGEVDAVQKELKDARIYLFNGLNSYEFSHAVRHNIIPMLNTLEALQQWGEYAKQIGKKLPAVIHLETGMGRLGLQESEIEKAASSQLLAYLDICYICSHLACADYRDHLMNQQQLKLIHKYAALFPNTKISMANSAGIFLGKEYHLDQVRCGCAIYGVNPIPANASQVIQVATLNAYVLQLKTLERDQSISYGARYHAKKGAQIATLACGYADGYHRLLTQNAFGFYAGYRVPIVGTVTMDTVMADVSEVPAQLLEKMEYIELLGDNITVDELAERANTIGYEILTSLGSRFKKIYIE